MCKNPKLNLFYFIFVCRVPAISYVLMMLPSNRILKLCQSRHVPFKQIGGEFRVWFVRDVSTLAKYYSLHLFNVLMWQLVDLKL